MNQKYPRMKAALIWLCMAFSGAVSCIQVPKTTAYDPELSRTMVGDYAFHTETFGDSRKPPLIVVHGGPGGDFEYLRSLSALGDEYHVLFYDERGSGLSPRLGQNAPPIPIARYVEDLDALVGIHGKGQPVRLVGHSWGAMIATAYVARHPGRVSHAVIAEPGILRPESGRPFVEGLKAGQKWTTMVRGAPVFFFQSALCSHPGWRGTQGLHRDGDGGAWRGTAVSV